MLYSGFFYVNTAPLAAFSAEEGAFYLLSLSTPLRRASFADVDCRFLALPPLTLHLRALFRGGSLNLFRAIGTDEILNIFCLVIQLPNDTTTIHDLT